MINKLSIRIFLYGYFNMHGLIQILLCLLLWHPIGYKHKQTILKHTCSVIYYIKITNTLTSINSSVLIVINLERRCAKFICSCLNSENQVKTITELAKCSSVSNFEDNYRYLSYKYKIENHAWDSPFTVHRSP